MDSKTRDRIQKMLPLLDEKQRRLYLAAESESMGHGGLQAIHELTGISKTTIIKGKYELKNGCKNDDGRIRRNGGGRKAVTQKYTNITEEIEQIIENSTVGNPDMVVLWTTKSLRGCLESLQQY